MWTATLSEIERGLFSAREAERSLVSAMLKSDKYADKWRELSEGDFTSAMNLDAYKIIRDTRANGESIDVVMLCDKMANIGYHGGEVIKAWSGGVYSLDSLLDNYVAAIKKATLRRQIAAFAQDLVRSTGDMSQSETDLITLITDKGRALLDGVANDDGVTPMHDAVLAYLQRIDQAMRGENTGEIIGISAIDTMTRGIFKGDLTVIAGRPGTGKTAMALHITHALASSGLRGLVVSREMGAVDLVNRMVSAQTGVRNSAMRSGEFTDDECVAAVEYAGKLSHLPVVFDTRSNDVAGVLRNVERMHARQGIDFLVVDYLQLVEGSSKRNGTRNDEVAEVSRAMKTITQRYEIPVILLSQLNREGDPTKPPTLRNLRDSGSIEQDANNVWILWGPSGDDTEPFRSYYAEKDMRYVRVEILKQREGAIGAVDIVFNPSVMQFFDLPATNKEMARELEREA